MCRLRNNIALESVTDGQTDGQSDPYVSPCFAGDTKSTFKYYNRTLPILAHFQNVPRTLKDGEKFVNIYLHETHGKA